MNLFEAYSEQIKEHSNNPRWVGKCEQETASFTAYNPLCGDRVTLSLNLDDQKIIEARAETSGCAFCRASTSCLLSSVQGLLKKEAIKLVDDLLDWSKKTREEEPPLALFAAFAPICTSPMRLKCVTLSWHALKNTIEPLL